MSVTSEAGKIYERLHSNEAINKILINKPVAKVLDYMNKPFDSFYEGGVSGHMQRIIDGVEGEKFGVGDVARLGLQTYALGSTAGRVLSGGGVYKDANGNTNLVGIPFI